MFVEVEIVLDGIVVGESWFINKIYCFEDSGELNMVKVRNGKYLFFYDFKVRKKIDIDGIIFGDRLLSEEK